MITTNIEMTAGFWPAIDMSACASAFHGVKTTGGVSAVTPKLRLDGTTVSAYRGTTGGVVAKAFPGTSAWSPPI